MNSSTSRKVFITRVMPEVCFKLLLEAGCELTVHEALREPTREELVRALQTHDVLLSAGRPSLTGTLLHQAHRLKAISLYAVGYDNVDIKAATDLGIPVGNTPDVLSQATADTAFLLMLGVARNAMYLHQKIRQGRWKFYEPTADLGQDIEGKTLGILGLGRIGLELARKASAAFDMPVIYHNRNRNPEAESSVKARYVSFDELLEQSDVLSVHADLNASNANMFNREAFRKMKPNAIFINTARGGLHNEADLYEALREGWIWGAGLDVTNPEPMASDHPLLDLPHVWVLPHIGSATVETRDAMAILAAKNIIAALNGERMPALVNPEVYANPGRLR